ncbi:MAG: HlyD family efflux transporter periplasmic adaptor subunit [Polyangiaceae bacterium]|jgi:multidrug efflux pump subunit AcrA (membrane-fusion protein)|nr:HlyD family efflux transporter periplasmic adaptor subunit [Polyangiaceae bacterium]
MTTTPMDVRRTRPRRRFLRWPLALGLSTLALGGAAFGLRNLAEAAPTVERTGLWTGHVKRGPMTRKVLAHGTLVPEQMRWVSALTAGRIDRVALRPGAPVAADEVLVELSNPDVELAALEAEQGVSKAEADLAALRVTVQTQRLSQQSLLNTQRAELRLLEGRRDAYRQMGDEGISSRFEADDLLFRAGDAAAKLPLEEQRLEVLSKGAGTQVKALESQLTSLRKIAEFRRRQLDSLHVRAAEAGVLQELPLEVGQWVMAGALLAKVARPDRLRAEVRVAEVQARDVQRGLTVSVDTRNGVVAGRVSRIDPAAQGGMVKIEVSLEGELPRGARPDQGVEASVELETLDNVLSMPRPALAQPGTEVTLFRVASEGDVASRVRVRLGRASTDAVEVLGGLGEGDRVVLTDMTAWEKAERLRLR